MLNIIAFSKNRPAQLDALMRSFLFYFKDLNDFKFTVIYRATTKEYETGYNKLFSNYPTQTPEWNCFNFVKETDFKRNVENSIDTTKPLTMFLVDDLLFKAPFSLKDKEIQLVLNNKEILATSLRLWSGINHCYATNQPSKVPVFTKGYVWKWRSSNGTEGDWAYPFSLDGNIFRTDFIINRLRQIKNYTNPNTLEACLSMDASAVLGTGLPEYMCCYTSESKLINIPANIVQTEFKNRVGNLITPEELNERYLTDQIIDIKETIKQAKNNNTVHAEIPYIWTKL